MSSWVSRRVKSVFSAHFNYHTLWGREPIPAAVGWATNLYGGSISVSHSPPSSSRLLDVGSIIGRPFKGTIVSCCSLGWSIGGYLSNAVPTSWSCGPDEWTSIHRSAKTRACRVSATETTPAPLSFSLLIVLRGFLCFFFLSRARFGSWNGETWPLQSGHQAWPIWIRKLSGKTTRSVLERKEKKGSSTVKRRTHWLGYFRGHSLFRCPRL